MTIFLFTNFFPLQRSEPFLTNEFPFTAGSARRIVILPFYGSLARQEVKLPENVAVKKPVFRGPAYKAEMFVRGLFSLSGMSLHLRDLLRVRNARQLKQWLVSLVVTRAVLSHKPFREMLKEISATPDALLYFYWGDNLAWTLPYMRKSPALKKTPALVRVHRTDLYEWLKGGRIPLRPDLMNVANLIVPISEDGRRYLENKYPGFSHKIFLSRIGVPDRGRNPAPRPGDGYTVVSVSAVIAVKRVKLILDSLVQSDLEITWHHFGDGPLLEDLRAEARLIGQKLRVNFHGFRDNSAVMEFYRTNPVHVFMNASFSEGLPVSVMEAMSFGIPVVAADAGGTSDLVDESTGVLVPVDAEAKTIAAAVLRILQLEGDAYAVMRDAARKRFQETANAEKNFPSFYEKIRELA